ncbi:MAG: hypothetical protein WBM32_23020 [Crocosphaera sp.]|jgi:hypothetical protein
MRNTQLKEFYPFFSSQEQDNDNYYLMRLTQLWGEDCFYFDEEPIKEVESNLVDMKISEIT